MARKFGSILIFLSLVFSVISESGASAPYADDSVLEQRKQVIRVLFTDLGLPRIDTFDTKTMVPYRQDVHKWTLEESKKAAIDGQKPPDTYPRFYERVFRSSVSKFEVVQQPKTVLIQSGASLVPTANPDSTLFRYSSVTTYGELIPSVADVQAQADAVNKYGTDGKPICGALGQTKVSDRNLNCILRLGIANRFGRALSGVRGTFNYGQNPQIQQSLIVAGTAAAQKNFSLSGQVDYDPKNIFLSGTDWNMAYTTAKTYGTAMEIAIRQKIRKTCNLRHVDDSVVAKEDKTIIYEARCAQKLSGPTGWQLVAAFLTPQTSYQVKNQFDFVKQNGALIAAPFPTNSLQDVTFSLDLTRVFPSAKSRTDALATLAAFKNDVGVTKSDAKANVEKLYLALMTDPDTYIGDKKWYEGLLKALVNVYQTN